MADRKKNPVKYGEVVAKCWKDEAYKKRFIEDPEGVLAEAGFVGEEGVTYKVVEAPKMVEYMVLPHADAKKAVQDVAKRFLNHVETGKPMIPDGAEIRILQNTDDTRYLILPASPKALTQAELKMVAGGGEVEEQTYIELQAVEFEAYATSTTVATEAEVAVVVVGVLI